MRIVSKKDIQKPLKSPPGEVIYELIGASEKAGGTEKHSLAIVTIPPGKSSAEHYHVVSEETYYVLRGTVRLVIDDRVFQLTPGQACLIQPLERHQIFNSGADELEFIAVCAPAWTPDDSIFV
jgi:mannose-6-phosphate isomerase-like protein (cupin superfamily)